MPNVNVSISNLKSSVERPVVYDVVRQMMRVTKIAPETPIRFYGDEGKAAQQNSTLTNTPGVENLFDYDERVIIEIEEEFDRDRLLATSIKTPEHFPIFKDEALGVVLKPIYASSDMTVRVKYRAIDENQAKRWYNTMRTNASLLCDINLHELTYHYQIPESLMLLVREIHTLREAVAGYGDSYDTYFTTHLTPKASIVTNLNGTASVWAVSETQIGVQGYFDFQGIPDKPEKEGDHDVWVASFSYKFKYCKPIECNFAYPLVVHNQLLGSRFRPSEKAYSLQDKLSVRTLSGAAHAEFESDTLALRWRGSRGLSIPSFDEFLPNSIPSGTVRVFTALSTVTELDQKTMFNLSELGDMNLDSDVLDFIRASEYPFITDTYASILCLNLYSSIYLRAAKTLAVTSALQVSAVSDLDLRKTHRVRLGLVANLTMLRPQALERLRKHPAAAIKIAKAIDAVLRETGNHPDIRKNKLTAVDYVKLGLSPTGNYLPLVPNPYGTAWNPLEGGGPAGLGGGLPLRKSPTYPPGRMPWGLVQTLFIASRNVADQNPEKPDSAYGPTT